ALTDRREGGERRDHTPPRHLTDTTDCSAPKKPPRSPDLARAAMHAPLNQTVSTNLVEIKRKKK
ncbi:MAG: hypothetical protein ACODAD_15785, partial [Planctomycetota bacterium]